MDTATSALTAQPLLVPASNGAAARFIALPAKTKIAFAAGIAALLGLLVLLLVSTRDSDQRVLFANLSDKDGGAVIERLQQMNVPFRLAEGGVIFVPASRVTELRMTLAKAGLPRASDGGGGGYELLDKVAFGQTQGQERATMQRALEGELARSISGFDGVKSARVHLALPPQTGFFREQPKPTASVLLAMHGAQTPDRALLNAIAHTVARGVPGLNPKSVGVTDTSGAQLMGDEDRLGAMGLDAKQLEYVQQVEASYLRRVQELLGPVVGRENLRATVTADIDFSQSESTSEEFKPNQGEAPATVRSMRTEESTQPGGAAATGVPGAQSNQPPTPPTAPINGAAQPLQGAGGGGGTAGRREADTRYEVDRTVRVTRNATGTVRRLTAAVVVNHRGSTDPKGKAVSAPLPADELEKLTALVQQGIGFNAQRGDSVRVINAPFYADVTPEAEAVPLWKQPWVVDLLRTAAAPAALVLATLMVLLMLVRPALKAMLAPPLPPAPPESTSVGGSLDTVVGDQAALPAPAPDMRDDPRLQAARALAKENPVAVATIMRGWVSGDQAV